MYQDKIEQEAVNSEDLGKQEFQAMFDGNDFSHQIAFDFYNHYAKSVGFGARKSKTWKNSKGEYVKQLFVCSREGFRPEKYYNIKNRKRKPKSETRCGCLARFVVRFMAYTGRWHVALLVESHNHDCLNPRLVGFLPTHRKIAEAYASQMNNMKDAGISTPYIYAIIIELPKSLVLTRWSKNAKTSTFDSSGVTWKSIILSQYGYLMDWCQQLSYVASRRKQRFHLVRDTIMSLIEDFNIEDEQEKQVGAEVDGSDGIFPKNPQNCRSKSRPGEKVKRKPQ
ncbi:hypothetical protein Ahy_B09g098126 [Arachis hypogaea]|uniref:FAR1 domain-containing protein n=1 Tax=Arachis hypogaea TaxID=3818 RepID=A0A444XQP9_ARAHY|nr:hypothetical protein Ahy_B09g098126 [Arachis hypogaea]